MLGRHGVSTLISCLQKNINLLSLIPASSNHLRRSVCMYSTTQSKPKTPSESSSYKLVVVGGGSAGCAVAAKFSSLGKQVAVIEPSDMHYYQPLWTLVGAGLKGFQESVHPMSEVLPYAVEWIKDRAITFNPQENYVLLKTGEKVYYQYLVVAMGIQVDFNQVKGLTEALENDLSVVSNYDPRWVNKTFPAIQQFQGGNAIFTFPNTPIKCAGAPQKIMYLADEFFRRNLGVRDKTNVIYNTSLGVMFGVKKYAAVLDKLVQKREIKVNYKHNLVEVDYKKRAAVFEKLDDKKLVTFKYDFLHVTPPMSSPDVLKGSPLVNEAGWVDVHKHTLQHTHFANVFSLGDCSSLPTSKTAAAAASQSGVLFKNLSAVMVGGHVTPLYDGYTSCPLVTSSETCILAEFDYDGQPLETFPIDQSKERKIAYSMKAEVLPILYWQMMTRGKWSGPSTVRKVMHLGLSRKPKMT